MPADMRPGWSPVDLKRPASVTAALGAFALVAAAVTVAACNVHELGHAAVASMLGWEVERIDLCLPAGGGVTYARVGQWAANAQGYAGGLTAAAVLGAVYRFVFARRQRPLQAPTWWFAGLGLAVAIGPQVVIGVLEGAVHPGEDYTQRYAPWLVPLTSGAIVAAATAYGLRWRAPWSTPGVPGPGVDEPPTGSSEALSPDSR